MNWLKQHWVKFSLGVVILITLISIKSWNNNPTLLITETYGKYPVCADAILAQSQYLEKEKLSEDFSFEKYVVSNTIITQPADLDINSSQSARDFRTMIRNGLKEGVNFAGHYSIVGVGMTGWGYNYWIVDRLNGKAYTFPYIQYELDFRKDSDLIIMNSKPIIKKALIEAESFGDICSPYGIGAQGILYTDLRPFYFLWEDNKLKLLGPTDIKPPINKFWEEYFD